MSTRKPLSSYRSPDTWPVWIGMGLLRLACLLPHGAALALGRAIGRLAHALGGSRRAIVHRNLPISQQAEEVYKVKRSANGIIDDPEQVRSYGLLVEREGRRLTEMIGRSKSTSSSFVAVAWDETAAR